jgi:hypothetical protein
MIHVVELIKTVDHCNLDLQHRPTRVYFHVGLVTTQHVVIARQG